MRFLIKIETAPLPGLIRNTNTLKSRRTKPLMHFVPLYFGSNKLPILAIAISELSQAVERLNCFAEKQTSPRMAPMCKFKLVY